MNNFNVTIFFKNEERTAFHCSNANSAYIDNNTGMYLVAYEGGRFYFAMDTISSIEHKY